MFGWLVVRDGYITNPNLGRSLPTTVERASNQDEGFFSRVRNAVPNWGVPSVQPFSGAGRVLGYAPLPQAPTAPSEEDAAMSRDTNKPPEECTENPR